jgi:uncharacterized protein (TIGR02145 family)
MKPLFYPFALFLVIAFSGCDPVTVGDKPVVTTSPAAQVLWTEVILGGNVTDAGSEFGIERGVFWGTSSTPQSGGQKLSDQGGSGVFNLSLDGLTAKTTYYFQAYATNDNGTGYGEVLSFTTGGVDGTFTDSRDGSSYQYTNIGTQSWMMRNLEYLPSVGPSTLESQTEAHWYVYDYEGTDLVAAKASANYKTYGTLYNWTAARGACPAGWHLPTDAEWKTLEMYLGLTQADADEVGSRGSIAIKMKNQAGWSSGNVSTNSSGFSIIPGGFTFPGGGFGSVGSMAQFWTATESDASQAWTRIFYGAGPAAERRGLYKSRGYSVRCVSN